MDLANITITGRLGGDPEGKDINGTPIASFSVASNLGKKGDDPTWFRVTVWGRQSAACLQYLAKGSEVTVAGDFKTRVAEASGKTYLEVKATAVKFAAARDTRGEESQNVEYDDTEVPF